MLLFTLTIFAGLSVCTSELLDMPSENGGGVLLKINRCDVPTATLINSSHDTGAALSRKGTFSVK